LQVQGKETLENQLAELELKDAVLEFQYDVITMLDANIDASSAL
jgi:hypothetical protein